MMTCKKIGASAAVVAALIAVNPAAAGPLQDINVLDGTGNTIASNVFKFQYTDANAVAVGKGPFGSDPFTSGPNPFDLYYQSTVTSFLDRDNNTIFGAQSPNYQFTVAAQLLELAVPGDGPNSVNFIPQAGTISLFYDDFSSGVAANSATGVGFTDGIEIARFSVVGGVSSFTLIDAGTGTGSTNFNFELVTALDFVNEDYLQGVEAPIFNFHFTSQLAFPPVGTIPSGFFTSTTDPTSPYQPYVSNSTQFPDLFLQVQGSNTFSRVPEPGTIALFALGLIGLGFAMRRRGFINPATK